MRKLIRKILFVAALAALASQSHATTFAPIQLLNPSGSTIGQVITSTGASSAPAWANVSISSLTGVLGIANGGTGQTTAAAAAHALGLGSNDTPTFFGVTINGSTAHGLIVGEGNGVPVAYTAAGTSGQALLSGGASADPAYGALALSALATQAANTVLANATASSATPTAFSMPSCSTSASALNWTTSTGFTCNASVNAATLGGATFASPGAIGGTTAGSGAFTTLSASSTVSGSGFSTYLASPPAIGTTASAAGKFTTLQATSTITPSTTAGIVGTTAADNAQAGSDGEFASNTTSGTAITSGTTVNATSVSLTAGDWNCWGQALYVPSAGAVVADLAAGITTTSATLPASPDTTYLGVTLATGGTGTTSMNPMIKRINVSSTTTVYLVAEASSVTVASASVNGYIQCRRVR